ASVRSRARRAARLSARRAAKVSSSSPSVLPRLASNCANRSNGSNGRPSPWSRTIRTRASQSVFSPWMRWPTTSNGLQVSGPSSARTQSSGRPRRSASRTAGVRSRMAREASRSKRMGNRCSVRGRSLLAVDPLPVAIDPEALVAQPHVGLARLGVERQNEAGGAGAVRNEPPPAVPLDLGEAGDEAVRPGPDAVEAGLDGPGGVAFGAEAPAAGRRILHRNDARRFGARLRGGEGRDGEGRDGEGDEQKPVHGVKIGGALPTRRCPPNAVRPRLRTALLLRQHSGERLQHPQLLVEVAVLGLDVDVREPLPRGPDRERAVVRDGLVVLEDDVEA